MANLTTAVVAAVAQFGGIPRNEITFSTTESGPLILTALVGGVRRSVRVRVG